ncbi:hypothetical protein [Pedococcus sp. 5OH_020]|uniref:hypothetical protein n=1 Tax=Pedococcus sp. 5OH_020 TaxID=2989814 RepID=UPI0022EA013C|nr:hypothetical protein [Pedococcus sp. 5OH_020]
MADLEDWSAADDSLVRGALATLRADVEATPLPDVRFVKARGVRRRRRQVLTVAAAGAAAAAVVGTVGLAQLDKDPGRLQPATHSTTATGTTTAPSPATTTTGSLDQPGALPLPQEWAASLSLSGRPRLTSIAKGSSEWSSHECLTSVPVGQVQRQQVTVPGLSFEGGQTRFRVPASLDPQTVAEGIAADVAACQAGPGFRVTSRTGGGWPRLYSYRAGDAGSGWFAVVPGAADVTLLQVVDPGHDPSSFTQAQVHGLALLAERRLSRYGSAATPGGSPSRTSPTGTNFPAPRFTKALDERMPVAGVAPLLSWKLFVAPSQWTSPRFAGGAKAYAEPGALDGSSAIVECETDQQQAGVGGRYGIVSIRTGKGQGTYLGRQRVRLFEDVQGYELVQADIARLDRLLMAGCTSPGGNRTTAERGPVAGTYLLTTRVSGAPTSYQYVGITGQQTEGAVSTIVFHGSSDGQGFQGTRTEGFSELVRLMQLARQK